MPSEPTTRRGATSWRRRSALWVAVALPAAVMLALGSWGLDRPSMFGSEAEAYWAAHLSVPNLFHLLGHIDAVHGTYYLFMHGWFGLGVGPTWMRVPSMLAMTGAVAVTSLLTLRLTGSRIAGCTAGLLLALLPSMSSWAQSGRSYAIVTFAVTLLAYSLLRASEVRDGLSWVRWAAFGAMTVVCGYLHEMTLLLVPAFMITLLWARASRRVMLRWTVVTALAVALVGPLLVISSRESRAVAYLPRPTGLTLIGVAHLYFGPTNTTVFVLAACCLAGLAYGMGGARQRGTVTAASFALPALVVPTAVLFVESRYGKSLFDPRYVLYGAVAMAVLAASGLQRIGSSLTAWLAGRPVRALAVVPALLVCALAATLSWSTQQFIRTLAGHGQDYGGATAFLAEHARRGDGVLFSSDSAHSAELGYPNRFRRLEDLRQGVSPVVAGTFVGTPVTHDQLYARIAAHDRIWVLGPYPLPPAAWLHRAAPSLYAYFRPTTTADFAGVSDVLYQRVVWLPRRATHLFAPGGPSCRVDRDLTQSSRGWTVRSVTVPYRVGVRQGGGRVDLVAGARARDVDPAVPLGHEAECSRGRRAVGRGVRQLGA